MFTDFVYSLRMASNDKLNLVLVSNKNEGKDESQGMSTCILFCNSEQVNQVNPNHFTPISIR